MVNIISDLSKYVLIILIVSYTYHCFSVFGYSDIEKKHRVLVRQNVTMYLIQFVGYFVMYLQSQESKYLYLYFAQTVLIAAIIALYINIYPMVSRLVLNNMCMLLSIGIMMISRLDFEKAIKQFVILLGSMVISLFVPVIIRKARFLSNAGWTYIYAGIGALALLSVLIIGQTSGGAKLGFSIAGFGVQPSELVKILFVFFVASSLYHAKTFKDIVITTAIAAAHVLILVISTDLGAAVILFVVYLVMLYVATKQPLYMLAGLTAGGGASVVAYYLFTHVRTRVNAWKDPFAAYDRGGYQIAQSLMAIGTGSWVGMGIYQGMPLTIPVADEDFIFSAIAEELGLIFALCLILLCVSCYIMFLNIAMQIHNQFYKLIALGLGTCYIFQVFLTIGGVTKFIPSTGVTLPLISYGGSSLLSTLIMFAIIQGLYILREDEEEDIERKKKQHLRREGTRTRKNANPSPSRVQKKATNTTNSRTKSPAQRRIENAQKGNQRKPKA